MRPLDARIVDNLSSEEVISPFAVVSSIDTSIGQPELPEWVRNGDMAAEAVKYIGKNVSKYDRLVSDPENPRHIHVLVMKEGEYVEIGSHIDARDHDGSRAKRIAENRRILPNGVFRDTLY